MTQAPPTSRFPSGQTLLLDADDTLWENNIYFERAIAAFISCLDHHEYSPDEVRLKLNEVERETILSHGYGVSSFRQSLITCFERLYTILKTTSPPANASRSPASPSPSSTRRSSSFPASRRPFRSSPRAIASSSSPRATTPNRPTNSSAPDSRPTSPPSRFHPKKIPTPTTPSAPNTNSRPTPPG